jgi:hypothetical protein
METGETGSKRVSKETERRTQAPMYAAAFEANQHTQIEGGPVRVWQERNMVSNDI